MKKTILSLLLVVFAVFLTDNAQAEHFALRNSLKEKEEPFCKSLSTTFWGQAKHPGGNRNGNLNEKNDGLGIRCFVDTDQSLYYHADGLTNSQRGQTFLFGIGKKIPLVTLEPVTVYIAGSLTFVAYESPLRDKTIYGFLPTPQYGIDVLLPRKLGTLGLEVSNLPQGIKIAYITLKRTW